MKKILVTGGAGFIGSHFVRQLLASDSKIEIVNLDALTYAGKKENLSDIKTARHTFVKGDIRDKKKVAALFKKHGFDAVVNFAAESHVDNSIVDPDVFIQTNVAGTHVLLEAARRAWGGPKLAAKRFLQISTDEVYGSLPENDPGVRFVETTTLDPSSPYSASKASADLLVLAYHRTYKLPVLITRCSNNYGPNQDGEKLIPTMIRTALRNGKLPVYGDGKNVRDWIHVKDHCEAVEAVLRKGRPGQVYNIGADNERTNIEIVKTILKILKKPESLISYVQDRPGHDRRYGIDGAKAKKELGWRPKREFEQGLEETIQWYKERAASKPRK